MLSNGLKDVYTSTTLHDCILHSLGTEESIELIQRNFVQNGEGNGE